MKDKYFLRNIYNLLDSREIRIWIIHILRKIGVPYIRIGFDTNNMCNLRCIICYFSLKNFKPKPHVMTLSQFETIAKDVFPKTRILDLSCSYEPFMTKNFLDYLRIARKYTPGTISICTNGLLLNKHIVETLFGEALIDEIDISMDGLSETCYNSIRIGGDFNNLLNKLELLRIAKENYPHKIKYRINYTMMLRNIEEVMEIHDFARQYSIDMVQLRHVKLTSEFKNLFNESLVFHKELFDKVMKKVIGDFKNDKSIILIHPPLFSLPHLNAARKLRALSVNFMIDAFGNLMLCNIGTVATLSLVDSIYNSTEVKQ
jgi:MoaA/NifB/PqqE/SkfB family radical SAM enzyme